MSFVSKVRVGFGVLAFAGAVVACSSSSSSNGAQGTQQQGVKTCADLTACCNGLSDPEKSACTAAQSAKVDQACVAFWQSTCGADAGAGSSSGGSSGGGSSLVWCDAKNGGMHYCGQAADSQTCTQTYGTVVSACSTSGLAGKCSVGPTATYYYSDSTTSTADIQSACTSGGGTWTTS
jgi:hypothetical protein